MGNSYIRYSDDSYIIIKRKNGNIEKVPFGKRSKRNKKHRKTFEYTHNKILYFVSNNGQWVPVKELKTIDELFLNED